MAMPMPTGIGVPVRMRDEGFEKFVVRLVVGFWMVVFGAVLGGYLVGAGWVFWEGVGGRGMGRGRGVDGL